MENFIVSSHSETTIDYPGKMAIILFTPGCNFRCNFCHNPELVFQTKGIVDVNILLKNIQARKNAGWYSGVVISGGEPTIQLGLIDFIKKLKEIGLAVKLDTNGTNPNVIERLLEESLVDYIAMDIKNTKENYSKTVNVNIPIERIEKSIKLASKFPVCEFRTTLIPALNENDFQEMIKWVSSLVGKPRFWTLQQFNPQKTLDTSFQNLPVKSKEEIKIIENIFKDKVDEVRVLM